MKYFRYALTVLLALGPCVTASAEDWHWGPVEVSNMYPLAALHRSTRPRSADINALSEQSIIVQGGWASTSALKSDLRVDAETRALDFIYKRGVAEDLEISFIQPLVWRGGGVLDSFIDYWHDWFGLQEGNRGKVDDDVYRITGENEDGSNFDLDGSGTSLGMPEISLAYSINEQDDSYPAATISTGLSFPAARSEFSQDGVDADLSLLLSRWEDRLGIFLGGGVFYFSDTEESNIEFSTWHVEGFAHAEYRVLESASLLIGIYGGNGVVEDVQNHPEHFFYLDVGGRVSVAEKSHVELLVRENPWSGYSASDVSMHLGTRLAF
jgi:hypothetical protein